MNQCNKCHEYGLQFNRSYKPEEFLEGKVNSDVWIVGLNPGQEEAWTDEPRNVDDLADCFNDLEDIHSYFKDFKKVSPKLFAKFGKNNGVAHTDLVKCSSKNWPPKLCKGIKNQRQLINNCKGYLEQQIDLHKPKMIICNGAPVSHQIKEILQINKWLSDTSYESDRGDGTKVVIVLSGFIGRIDDFSKRRLGYEIEGLLGL